jgi:hypothetical protein
VKYYVSFGSYDKMTLGRKDLFWLMVSVSNPWSVGSVAFGPMYGEAELPGGEYEVTHLMADRGH